MFTVGKNPDFCYKIDIRIPVTAVSARKTTGYSASDPSIKEEGTAAAPCPGKIRRGHPACMMKSIRDIYKVGKGPSSSHTMGPAKAASDFRKETPEADAYRVTLYGSLSKTGRGHGTDRAVMETLAPIPTEVIFA